MTIMSSFRLKTYSQEVSSIQHSVSILTNIFDSAANFDNVKTKFVINKRTETDLHLCFTITRTQNGQKPGINEGKRRSKLAVNKYY